MKKILENGVIMTENGNTTWYCKECPENKHEDCGEWTENNSELFKHVKQIHQNHKGWKQGKPKPSAKEELEKQATCAMGNMIEKYANNKQEFVEDINEKFCFHSENAGKEITKQILNYLSKIEEYTTEDVIADDINHQMKVDRILFNDEIDRLWRDGYLKREIIDSKRNFKFNYSIIKKWLLINKAY